MNLHTSKTNGIANCLLISLSLAALSICSLGCEQTPKLGEIELPAGMMSNTAESVGTSVKVAEVKSVNIGEVLKLPISLEGFERTMLSPRVEGYVAKVNVDIGDEVQVGDVLIKLDVPELKAEYNRREMMLKQAKQGVESARAKLEQTRSKRNEMQAMVDLRQSELSRIQNLVAKGSLSTEKLDEARFGIASAQASLESVAADINAAQADIESAHAAIGVADAELAKAEAMWNFRQIVSPIEGVITMRNVDPGAYVVPSADSDSALVKIERVSKLRGVMNAGSGDIKIGTEVVLMNISSSPGVEIDRDVNGKPLKISRVANVFDPQSRLMRVEVDVLPSLNPKTKQRALKPGDYATAGIVLGDHPNQNVVPAAAIGKDDDGTFVIAVTSNRVCIKVPVNVVGSNDDQRAITAGNGIALKGMQVIIESLADYKDGQELDENTKLETK